MFMLQREKKYISNQASQFLRLLRNEKSNERHGKQIPQNDKSAEQIQLSSKVNTQQKVKPPWNDIENESEMEAEQLFENLIPKENQQQIYSTNLRNQRSLETFQIKSFKNNHQDNQINHTKPILKKGKIGSQQKKQSAPEIIQSQNSLINRSQQKRKIKFPDLLPLNTDFEKKWSDPIENQRKGKFDTEEERILSVAVGKFLVCNDISLEEFEQFLSKGERSEKVSKKQKIFSLLSTVLPNRSPESCYKYLKRNFNSLNRRGEWTQEQIDLLKSLVQKYGRKWAIISKQMKRSADNCYDKFRSLGEENMDQRTKGIWKFQELLQLLTFVQKMTKIKFLQSKAFQELKNSQNHDKIEKEQVQSRKYNSKYFIFHNLCVLKSFIDTKKFQKVDVSEIRWNHISTYLKTKSILDCRNKIVQMLQIFFHGQSKQLDQQIVNFFVLHKYQNEHEVNWKEWKERTWTRDQARNRYMIIKKMIEGRSFLPFKQIVYELKERMEKKYQAKSSEKAQQNQQK